MNQIAPPSAGMPRKSWSVRCKILSTLATTVALIVVVAIASGCRSSSALAAPSAATAPTTSAPAVTHARTMSAAVPTHKAQLSAPHVLIKMSGNGQGSSAPFLVTTSTVTATYTYNCSASGGSGNFIADMVYGDQASPNSDDQLIANALGTGGSATVTLYPTNVGQDYHLTVISECTWTVTLTTSAPAVTHAPTTSARCPRRVRDPGSPAPAGSVEQGGYRARADGATALADREGLAGVERDRLAKRDGDLHRLPWQGRRQGSGTAAAAHVTEVQHTGHVRGADVELRAVPGTYRRARPPSAADRRRSVAVNRWCARRLPGAASTWPRRTW